MSSLVIKYKLEITNLCFININYISNVLTSSILNIFIIHTLLILSIHIVLYFLFFEESFVINLMTIIKLCLIKILCNIVFNFPICISSPNKSLSFISFLKKFVHVVLALSILLLLRRVR